MHSTDGPSTVPFCSPLEAIRWPFPLHSTILRLPLVYSYVTILPFCSPYHRSPTMIYHHTGVGSLLLFPFYSRVRDHSILMLMMTIHILHSFDDTDILRYLPIRYCCIRWYHYVIHLFHCWFPHIFTDTVFSFSDVRLTFDLRLFPIPVFDTFTLMMISVIDDCFIVDAVFGRYDTMLMIFWLFIYSTDTTNYDSVITILPITTTLFWCDRKCHSCLPIHSLFLPIPLMMPTILWCIYHFPLVTFWYRCSTWSDTFLHWSHQIPFYYCLSTWYGVCCDSTWCWFYYILIPTVYVFYHNLPRLLLPFTTMHLFVTTIRLLDTTPQFIHKLRLIPPPLFPFYVFCDAFWYIHRYILLHHLIHSVTFVDTIYIHSDTLLPIRYPFDHCSLLMSPPHRYLFYDTWYLPPTILMLFIPGDDLPRPVVPFLMIHCSTFILPFVDGDTTVIWSSVTFWLLMNTFDRLPVSHHRLRLPLFTYSFILPFRWYNFIRYKFYTTVVLPISYTHFYLQICSHSHDDAILHSFVFYICILFVFRPFRCSGLPVLMHFIPTFYIRLVHSLFFHYTIPLPLPFHLLIQYSFHFVRYIPFWWSFICSKLHLPTVRWYDSTPPAIVDVVCLFTILLLTYRYSTLNLFWYDFIHYHFPDLPPVVLPFCVCVVRYRYLPLPFSCSYLLPTTYHRSPLGDATFHLMEAMGVYDFTILEIPGTITVVAFHSTMGIPHSTFLTLHSWLPLLIPHRCSMIPSIRCCSSTFPMHYSTIHYILHILLFIHWYVDLPDTCDTQYILRVLFVQVHILPTLPFTYIRIVVVLFYGICSCSFDAILHHHSCSTQSLFISDDTVPMIPFFYIRCWPCSPPFLHLFDTGDTELPHSDTHRLPTMFLIPIACSVPRFLMHSLFILLPLFCSVRPFHSVVIYHSPLMVFRYHYDALLPFYHSYHHHVGVPTCSPPFHYHHRFTAFCSGTFPRFGILGVDSRCSVDMHWCDVLLLTVFCLLPSLCDTDVLFVDRIAILPLNATIHSVFIRFTDPGYSGIRHWYSVPFPHCYDYLHSFDSFDDLLMILIPFDGKKKLHSYILQFIPVRCCCFALMTFYICSCSFYISYHHSTPLLRSTWWVFIVVDDVFITIHCSFCSVLHLPHLRLLHYILHCCSIRCYVRYTIPVEHSTFHVTVCSVIHSLSTFPFISTDTFYHYRFVVVCCSLRSLFDFRYRFCYVVRIYRDSVRYGIHIVVDTGTVRYDGRTFYVF